LLEPELAQVESHVCVTAKFHGHRHQVIGSRSHQPELPVIAASVDIRCL
jgi:hypothetical protein